MRPSSRHSDVIDRRRPLQRSLILVFSAAAIALTGAAAVRAEDDHSRLIEDARRDFEPVSERELDDARSEVRKRMKDVEKYVKPSSKNGRAWLHYLRWDQLDEETQADRPESLEAFDESLRQLTRNEEGLEKPRFRRLARALRRFRDLAAVSMWENPADIYNKQLEALQRDLEAFRKERSPRTEAALSERLRIIDSIGQAPDLVDALREDLAWPNAFIDIQTSLIAASAGDINRREHITDWILGANVHSNTRSKGTVDVVSIPSDNKSILEFRSKGHTFSQNTGYKGPAVIHSCSDTDFTARKRVELDDDAFITKNAKAKATTDIHLQSVGKAGGGLGSRLVSRMGWRRAQGSQPQAERISADHAETRIECHFNDELNDEVRKARKRYEEEYRQPLERRDAVPDYIRFKSDRDSIGYEVTQASRSQLGATGKPPAASETHDVTMRLHESAVDNYSASILGGATARQTSPDEDVKFDVKLPKWMKKLWENRKTEATDQSAKEEPFKEYALTLREGRPISVNFGTDKVKLTVHIARLQSGDKSFENWDVTGNYTPKLSDGRVELTRDGDLVMFPADFRGQLTGQQVAERRNLEEELNKRSAQGRGFPKTIAFDPVEPEGKLADAGPLEYNQFAAGDGWLTIGLDRQSKQ